MAGTEAVPTTPSYLTRAATYGPVLPGKDFVLLHLPQIGPPPEGTGVPIACPRCRSRALQEVDGVAAEHRPALLHHPVDPHAGHRFAAKRRHGHPVVVHRRPQNPDVPRQVGLR